MHVLLFLLCCLGRVEARRDPTAVVFPISAVVSTIANWPHHVTSDKANKQLNRHYSTKRIQECVCVCDGVAYKIFSARL